MMHYFITFLVMVFMLFNVVTGQPLVPALFIFGDSVFDVGNNNNLLTIVKSNFPPYGRDFQNHLPTGRFCNGKLTIDYTAENLGFTSYQPAYHNLKVKGNNLLKGANFASAASGYSETTAKLYNSIPLSQQLKYYKECQDILVGIVGNSNASSIVSGAIHLVNAGSTDFVQNYYINPLVYKVYTIDQFTDVLIENNVSFIQSLHALGARKIGVTTLPPLGCLPMAITLFGHGRDACVERLNNDAINFNRRLNSTSLSLQNSLSGLKLVVLDIYQPLLDIITKPSEHGFFEARKACCGTGLLETAILCNRGSIGTCANATEYVFWDSFHPTDATNKVVADTLLVDGISLIG